MTRHGSLPAHGTPLNLAELPCRAGQDTTETVLALMLALSSPGCII
jgi:hypothetical protein